MKYKITTFNSPIPQELLSEMAIKREIIFKEVEGHPVTINNIPCFIFKEEEETIQGKIIGYNVSHLETGMRLVNNSSKKNTILKAKERLNKFPNAINEGIEMCKKLGIKLPVNI